MTEQKPNALVEGETVYITVPHTFIEPDPDNNDIGIFQEYDGDIVPRRYAWIKSVCSMKPTNTATLKVDEPILEEDDSDFVRGLLKGAYVSWNSCIDYLVASGYLRAPQLEITALKRECRDPNEPIEEMLRNEGWNSCIDYLGASGYLKAPLPKIEGLRAALNNVCEPQIGGIFYCAECQGYYVTHDDGWFLRCGDKDHAEALIEAARAYLEASEGGHLDDINVVEMGIRE